MQQLHLQSSERVINMRQYNVQITDEALSDMEQLYNYIAYVLRSPENAMGQYRLISQVQVLSPM